MTKVVRDRLSEKRHFIQVILGPRQVGKTTAIQQILKTTGVPSHYAAADLPAPPDTGWIARQWEIARMKAGEGKATVLVLDEIQKVAHWSSEVKRLWDEDGRAKRRLHVVLLGSSSLLTQKGLSESLAGRFQLIRFPHWSWAEMKECFGFSFEQYIYFGGYPASASLMQDEGRWGQYLRDSLIETALSKDILLLNRVEKPILLRQLFVLACEYSGQVLSYQKILGQLQDAGNTVTVAHYQRLLEAAFLIKGLQKWSGQTIRSRSSSPKWLALNTGLVSALSNRSFDEWRQDPAQWGRLAETSVGAHLANQGALEDIDIYYWREGNHEVDFVLRKGSALMAIEVKSGQKRIESKGLSEFKKYYPRAKTLVVGTGGMAIKDFFELPVTKLVS